jgi:hypothetical protein
LNWPKARVPHEFGAELIERRSSCGVWNFGRSSGLAGHA